MIWGNHTIRAAIAAIKDAYRRILDDGGVHKVEKDIASVKEIFCLQDMDAIKALEWNFLR